jgi:CxxC motif-containing protein (DUF1111 family)
MTATPCHPERSGRSAGERTNSGRSFATLGLTAHGHSNRSASHQSAGPLLVRIFALLIGLVLGFALLERARAAGELATPLDGRLGGALSVADRTSRAFGSPGPSLSPDERSRFAQGDAAFAAVFVAAPSENHPGLGPTFNNASCNGCHIGDGRGQQVVGLGPRRSMALVKVSLLDGQPELPGGPGAVPGLGTQLQDHATFGFAPEASVRLGWDELPGAYADGTPYSLRRPRLSISLPNNQPLPPELLTSLRVAPPNFGRGLIEAIPDQAILALADPDDQNGDGISGRPNWVWDLPSGSLRLGRFGLKANTASLLQQTAGAYAQDMGISNPLFPDPDGSTDIDQQTLEAVTFYLQTLAVPVRRVADDPRLRVGETQFVQAGCAACHQPTLTTDRSPVRALANQQIFLYSDLLLHDLGPGLADGRPDFQASGSEWKTPPLWGLGLTETVLGGAGNYLHDGRARTIEEAILWHDGEAAPAREAFRRAPASDREALLVFLRSL